MSLLNFSMNLACYADELKSTNPRIKFADLSWSFLGLPTGQPQTAAIKLSPGETQTVVDQSRSLSFTGSTSFTVSAVAGTSYARLSGNFGQRIARTDGDSTTQWQITLINTLVTAQYTGIGTAPNFTSMQAGDGLTIDSTSFNQANQGDFVIVKVGTNYIQFVNALAIAELVTGQIDIYSSGPVQIGDILDISSNSFSFPNRGEFEVMRVNDQYIQFSNPAVVPETNTGVTSGLSVYPKVFQWMFMAVDNTCSVLTNGDTGLGMIVEPIVAGDFQNNPGILLKRGKVFRVDMTNNGEIPVNGTLFLAE